MCGFHAFVQLQRQHRVSEDAKFSPPLLPLLVEQHHPAVRAAGVQLNWSHRSEIETGTEIAWDSAQKEAWFTKGYFWHRLETVFAYAVSWRTVILFKYLRHMGAFSQQYWKCILLFSFWKVKNIFFASGKHWVEQVQTA